MLHIWMGASDVGRTPYHPQPKPDGSLRDLFCEVRPVESGRVQGPPSLDSAQETLVFLYRKLKSLGVDTGRSWGSLVHLW